MKILPFALILALSLWGGVAYAVTIAEQTQNYSDQLSVWQMIQELGTNLSGTADKFTFRVSTSRTNLNQFDYTAQVSAIFDKSNNNSYILGCVPAGSDPNDRLRGLTFNTNSVPPGYEDVTIDFSCRNYNFITGHKYLIKISNANMGNSGSGVMLIASVAYNNKPNADYFTGGGLRYANGNPFDYSNNSGSCNPVTYRWNGTSPWNNGCYVWGTPKDDIYFVLTNNAPPPPPPKLPVIFIPGIGGSEMKASGDIIWSAPDGHGGTYSHAYGSNEKVWVNQDEAVKLGDDDYFDVLRLKPDGVTPEANLSLTGNLTSFGYGDIDNFFIGMGYVKGTNYFVFNFDWRKDVRTNKDSLDSLIETAKSTSGQSKVNLVVHSLGGLIARNYIADSTKAAKVNKLMELGVPHLGSPWATKTVMYGILLGRPLIGDFGIGVVPSEVHDVSQNLPSTFQLLPSNQYFTFYNNSDKDHPYPFRDDRDIDNNKITGVLNYDQTKNLLSNLNFNMTVFGLGEQFHSTQDSIYNQTNGVKIYEIVGSNQPTLGQIVETWWITWPITLIPKRDEIFINGDDTIPLYSASLKSDSTDISGATKIYYVDQKHADLVSSTGTAMQTIKSLLNDDNAIPSDAKSEKILLEGQHISVDQNANLDLYDDLGNHTGLKSNGDVEVNIPGTFYDSLDDTRHFFVKKSKKVTAKITSAKTVKAKVRIRNYSSDSINKTILYNDVPLDNSTTVQFTVDPSSSTTPSLTSGTQTILATTEATGSAVLDQTPPVTSIQISGTKDSSGIYSGPVTITLTGSDSSSGILRIEYSLDNGKTVQIYTGPFVISTSGKTTIQYRSIDKLGNEEIPQTLIIEIAAATSSSTSSSSGTSSSSTSSDTSASSSTINSSNTLATSNTSKVGFDSFEVSTPVLGISFENPSHISDQINVTHLLDNPKPDQTITDKLSAIFQNIDQRLGGLLIVSGSIGALAAVGLALTFIPLKTLSFLKMLSLGGKTTFVKPFPK